MKERIDNATELGQVPEEARKEHKGFQERDLVSSKRDHPTILQLRVSSQISNGLVILTVDCDMYSNNSESLRDVMCFLMDEEKGQKIAFVQFPQNFDNITKNDVYSNSLKVEFPGLDANGGPAYIGTGCFHRRDTLCGKKYKNDYQIDWRTENDRRVEESTTVLEETCKTLASCSYEENTEWGKEVSSPWVLPFLYVIAAKYGYSLGEFLWSGGTFQEWWNDQRMWLYKRTTSYVFGFTETILKLLGFVKLGFVVTSKVADEDVSLRYKKEVMEFGAPSPMFSILATLSLVNLLSFFRALKMLIMDSQHRVLDLLALQMLLCGFVVVINLPVYGGLFFRKNKGRMPSTVTCQAVIIAIIAHIVALH
ncbi:hypothetical protein RHGRI_037060 [Rhododendron griersonianum]|uniref:Uncharacterized protein n=1 Tax=Rhododendron griersonianum TaxID=479676 RepID=A0AAV6HUP9_9ERIC|nr:hypothetical protein RHGRI_037060 [Rhododendron griersonianum]